MVSVEIHYQLDLFHGPSHIPANYKKNKKARHKQRLIRSNWHQRIWEAFWVLRWKQQTWSCWLPSSSNCLDDPKQANIDQRQSDQHQVDTADTAVTKNTAWETLKPKMNTPARPCCWSEPAPSEHLSEIQHVYHLTPLRGKPSSACNKQQSCWDNDSQLLYKARALGTREEDSCMNGSLYRWSNPLQPYTSSNAVFVCEQGGVSLCGCGELRSACWTGTHRAPDCCTGVYWGTQCHIQTVALGRCRWRSFCPQSRSSTSHVYLTQNRFKHWSGLSGYSALIHSPFSSYCFTVCASLVQSVLTLFMKGAMEECCRLFLFPWGNKKMLFTHFKCRSLHKGNSDSNCSTIWLGRQLKGSLTFHSDWLVHTWKASFCWSYSCQ